MIKPTFKTLSLRKAIIELVDQHEAKREVASNEELIAWREGWKQKITHMQTWETELIERRKQIVLNEIEKVVKTYKDLIQTATDKLLQKLYSVCPLDHPSGLREAMENKKLKLLLRFEKHKYKENSNTNQIAEDFLNTYQTNAQWFSLSKSLQERIRIGDSVPNTPENDHELMNYLFTNLLPHQLAGGNSQYYDTTWKMCLLLKTFRNEMAKLTKDKVINELLAK